MESSKSRVVLTLVPFPPRGTWLERQWRKIHGLVIDYRVWSVAAGTVNSFELHREAALQFMVEERESLKSYVKEAGRQRAWQFWRPVLKLEGPLKLTFDAEKMSAREIDVEQFLGPRYDLQRRCFLVEGIAPPPRRASAYFREGDEHTYENVVNFVADTKWAEVDWWDTEFDPQGYAYAFRDPPYPTGIEPQRLFALFQAINEELFSSFQVELSIFQWSNEWSSYFDAGLEWWGAFLWTVYNPSKNSIVAVGASSTD